MENITSEQAPAIPEASTTPLADGWGEVEVKLTFTEIKVSILDDRDKSIDPKTGAPKPPKLRRFIMREMDGMSRDDYLTKSNKKTEVGPDGLSRVVDFNGSLSELLARMLYEVHTVDGVDVVNSKPTALIDIQSWPAKAQMALYQKALPISGLHERAVIESKNA
jgi:hypothetical protein